MRFVFTNGIWRNAKNMKNNDEEKFYVVTLGRKDRYHRQIADEYWRFNNDRWEMFFEGKWQPLKNNLWEVIAYTEIIELKPCELGE
jgi:hypothetical protein